jgi:uncharacterized caspase-like protein
MGFNMFKIAKYVLPFAGLVPLAFGISYALGKIAPEKPEPVNAAPAAYAPAGSGASRIALIIGNADYPDASAPLRHPVQDAQALAEQLRRGGFEVDVQENLGKDELRRAVEAFKAKIRPGTVAFVSFGGFGIQVDRQSYMVPVNAQIWKEADVRREGVSIDALLNDMHARGASVKLAVFDASRRNPYERRFRGVSSGLAAIDAPQGTLLLSAAAPGKVAYDGQGEHGLLIGELLKEIHASGASAEVVFNHTRIGVSRASNGEQVPLVSSSLVENFAFVPGAQRQGRTQQAYVAETPKLTSRTEFVDPAPHGTEPVDLPSNAAPVQNVDPVPVKPLKAEKPVESKPTPQPAVEKPVPAIKKAPRVVEEKEVKNVKETKRPRREASREVVHEEVRRPRRNPAEVSRELLHEPPKQLIRRGLFSPWRVAGGGGFRGPFGRPGFGFGF